MSAGSHQPDTSTLSMFSKL